MFLNNAWTCVGNRLAYGEAQLLPQLLLRVYGCSGLATADGILRKKQSSRAMARCPKHDSLELNEGVDGRRRAVKLAAGCKLVGRNWFGQTGCGVE